MRIIVNDERATISYGSSSSFNLVEGRQINEDHQPFVDVMKDFVSKNGTDRENSDGTKFKEYRLPIFAGTMTESQTNTVIDVQQPGISGIKGAAYFRLYENRLDLTLMSPIIGIATFCTFLLSIDNQYNVSKKSTKLKTIDAQAEDKEIEMPLTIDLGQVNLDPTWQDIANKPFTSLGQGLVVNDGILTIDESKLGGSGDGYKTQFAYPQVNTPDGFMSMASPYGIRFDTKTPSEIISVTANGLVVTDISKTICSGFEFATTPICLSSRGNVMTSVTTPTASDIAPSNAVFKIGVLSVSVGIANIDGSWKITVNDARLFESPTDGEHVFQGFSYCKIDTLIVRYK